MRKLILIAAILFSTTAFCQLRQRTGSVGLSNKPVKILATIKANSDTLEIRDTSIHFIKIGDDVYEIVRKVELKKAEPKLEVSPLNNWYVPYRGDSLRLTPNYSLGAQ